MKFDDKTTYAPGKAPRPILVNAWYPAEKVVNAKRMPHRDYLEVQAEEPPLAKFSTKLVEFNRAVIAQGIMQKSEKELSDREKLLLDQFLDTPTACVRNCRPAGAGFPS
jgi:hypothetical protein